MLNVSSILSPAPALAAPLAARPATDRCDNTVQGIKVVTDDRGLACERRQLDDNGCCPRNATAFSCDSCRIAQQCCSTYETCVSCCMRPENVRPPAPACRGCAHQLGARLCQPASRTHAYASPRSAPCWSR